MIFQFTSPGCRKMTWDDGSKISLSDENKWELWVQNSPKTRKNTIPDSFPESTKFVFVLQ